MKLKHSIALGLAIGTLGFAQVVHAQGIGERIIEFAGGIVIRFGTIAAKEFEGMMTPSTTYTLWYNHTNRFYDVETFDEKDAVRWVPYESRRIAPKQLVYLYARGNVVHVRVKQNGATYDSNKGEVYLWDGQNAREKIK